MRPTNFFELERNLREGREEPDSGNDMIEHSAAAFRGHSSNLVGVAPGALASAAFNDAATALHVAGAREQSAHLFKMLEGAACAEDAAMIFQHYMAVMFSLEPTAPIVDRQGRRHYRASYLRLLRGWAYDNNGAEGAVLKGWVESRFGLLPTYHKEIISRFASPAWIRYVEEKMSSRFHNNAIYSQLDLLYEFAQWTLQRTHASRKHLRLFRGVLNFEEHQIVERIDRRRLVLRLNNLVSFTANRDMASWFGDYILETAVPICKVLFFDDLVHKHALKGEGEVLAIGGDYLVTANYY
jgi:NAD+---dinitrogen-reductase ADP-D-ribosyltransferase